MYGDIFKQKNGKYTIVGMSGIVINTDYEKEDIIKEYVERAVMKAEKDMETAELLEEKWDTEGKEIHIGDFLKPKLRRDF